MITQSACQEMAMFTVWPLERENDQSAQAGYWGTLMIVMDIHRYLSSNIKTHHEEHCNNHFNTASIHQFGFLINRSWGTSSNKQQGGDTVTAQIIELRESGRNPYYMCLGQNIFIHHIQFMVYGHTSTIHTIHGIWFMVIHIHPFYDGNPFFMAM
jgi:hypothetical protein